MSAPRQAWRRRPLAAMEARFCRRYFELGDRGHFSIGGHSPPSSSNDCPGARAVQGPLPSPFRLDIISGPVNLLGRRSTVGHLPLEQVIGVRIPASQPLHSAFGLIRGCDADSVTASTMASSIIALRRLGVIVGRAVAFRALRSRLPCLVTSPPASTATPAMQCAALKCRKHQGSESVSGLSKARPGYEAGYAFRGSSPSMTAIMWGTAALSSRRAMPNMA